MNVQRKIYKEFLSKKSALIFGITCQSFFSLILNFLENLELKKNCTYVKYLVLKNYLNDF